MTAVDKDGKNLFTENDIAELGNQSAKGIDKIFSTAQQLSGISASDVDELVKT